MPNDIFSKSPSNTCPGPLFEFGIQVPAGPHNKCDDPAWQSSFCSVHLYPKKLAGHEHLKKICILFLWKFFMCTYKKFAFYLYGNIFYEKLFGAYVKPPTVLMQVPPFWQAKFVPWVAWHSSTSMAQVGP